MTALSDASLQKLRGVHPDLQRVVQAAAQRLPFPVVVVEGVRTVDRQRELFAQGRTRPGKIVTWTMDSRHLVQRCGYGCAVDIAPVKPGGIDWENKARFFEIGAAMKAAAANDNIPVRWGYDWDGDGKLMEKGEYDGPHFELARASYP